MSPKLIVYPTSGPHKRPQIRFDGVRVDPTCAVCGRTIDVGAGDPWYEANIARPGQPLNRSGSVCSACAAAHKPVGTRIV